MSVAVPNVFDLSNTESRGRRKNHIGNIAIPTSNAIFFILISIQRRLVPFWLFLLISISIRFEFPFFPSPIILINKDDSSYTELNKPNIESVHPQFISNYRFDFFGCLFFILFPFIVGRMAESNQKNI